MKNENDNIVLLENVSKIYKNGNNNAAGLFNVSFKADRGELVLILGPSGSGKTTLLTLIAGLLEPTNGKILLFNTEIQSYTKKELQNLRAGKIGFIFQNFLLIDSLTASQNIELVLKFASNNPSYRKRTFVAKKDSKEYALQLLQSFGIEYLAGKYPTSMSQGEKQRVAVARSIANNADLILADEPTASLSADQGIIIIQLLHSFAKEQNKCVIVVSHDHRLEKYSDRIIVIEDGRIQNHL